MTKLSSNALNGTNQDFKESVESPTDDLLEQADIYIDQVKNQSNSYKSSAGVGGSV